MTLDRRGRDDTHLAALDGVRGVAILVVLIHNAAFVLQDSRAFLPKLTSAITATGWLGVQLFFVLSGFLITRILLNARGTPRFFRTFYIRRTLRIFPLYYAFLAAAFLIAPHLSPPSWGRAVREYQWWYWTYTSNWASPFGHSIPGLSHFWSLAVEEQFYLLWPVLVFFLASRGLARLCVIVIAATPVVRYLLVEVGLPALAAYEVTFARWDALALGALLAIVMREESGRQLLHRRMGQFGALALLALAVLVAFEHGFHESDRIVQVVGQTLVAALSVWLIHVCVAPTSALTERLHNYLSARWLRFLGKYSYAIYVVHFPIHRIASHYVEDAVNGADTNWRLLRLALYVSGIAATSILAAMVSWRVLEKPFHDLRDRLAPRTALSTGGTL